MTKKTTPETLAALPVMEDTVTGTPPVSLDYLRETALQIALQHHKINGGMMHPAQVIDHAKQFHAYLTGETK